MNEFYGNSLTYNSYNQFDLSDSDDYRENIYLQCTKCETYHHPVDGLYIEKDFYCNKCHPEAYFEYQHK